MKLWKPRSRLALTVVGMTGMAHAEATDHPLAKKVLIDIANEERVHAGEFARLLSILTADEDKFLAEGAEEVDEMAGD